MLAPLARVIFALGIRHVGGEMAGILVEQFNSLDKLANASREELMAIPAVGPKIADSITGFFSQEENKKIIQKLKDASVKLTEEKARPQEQHLSGQEFVITGRLEAFTRQQAEARVRELGGSIKDNVTRKTTYLVVGADPGAAKVTQAENTGTAKLTEVEFLKKIGASR